MTNLNIRQQAHLKLIKIFVIFALISPSLIYGFDLLMDHYSITMFGSEVGKLFLAFPIIALFVGIIGNFFNVLNYTSGEIPTYNWNWIKNPFKNSTFVFTMMGLAFAVINQYVYSLNQLYGDQPFYIQWIPLFFIVITATISILIVSKSEKLKIQ